MVASITYPIIAANQLFSGAEGVVIEPKDVVITLTAATANQSIIAGVAGYKVRVIGATFYSAGAAATLVFKNGSAGSLLYAVYQQANTSATPNTTLPTNHLGYCDTDAGVGLFADCGGVQIVCTLRYILYVPAT